MSWLLNCRFKFDAAHKLDNLPPTHPCTQLHGHTWQVDVIFRGGVLDEAGMLVDFHRIKAVVDPIINELDHHMVNEVLQRWAATEGVLTTSTCESLAFNLYHKIKRRMPALVTVRVEETEGNWSAYSELKKEGHDE